MANIEVITIPVNQLEEILDKLLSKKLSLLPSKIENSIDGKMNQKEAAKFIGKTEQTIISYRRRGLIPHYINKGTREINFYKHELIEFMRNSPQLIGSARK